ncbi:cell division cycle-associated protein 2 isoform X2 [Rhineura floridana]|nr:cell division cycle-associated protein 2 isoform X2 [Rhineura floridana]
MLKTEFKINNGTISNTDDSKAMKSFPMETTSNRKVLSECSNMQFDLHLGHEDCINSAKKTDSRPASCLSNVPMVNISTDAFSFSTTLSNVESPLVEAQPSTLEDAGYLTPNKGESEAKPRYGISNNQATPPVDFSALTVADFGITTGSFTKQCKEDSKSLLTKFRRRSTIGLRGSPENNSLIRYIAYQKRTKKQDTLSQASPFKCRNTLLKDKIAAFQSSFKPLEETMEAAIYTPDISKKTDTSLYEESKLDKAWPSECKRVHFEENRNQKSMNGETSADTHAHSIVYPSQKLLTGTTTISKIMPVLLASTKGSGCIALEASTGIPESACGIQFQPASAELSINATSHQSCKKVRFAEKQRLEIFDETKPPITPIQKGQLPSSSLHSVLKKTAITILTEDMEKHLDKRTKDRSDVLPDFKICESQQIERSTKPTDEMKVCNKELDSDSLCRCGGSLFSPSNSTEKSYPGITPVKQSLSQLNFYDGDLLQQSTEVVSTTECAVNSDLEETKSSFSELQATSVRNTRSSAKRKCVNKTEEMDLTLTTKTRAKCTSIAKIKNSTKFQKEKTTTKSSKKTIAARHKVFGKRRRRKKEPKALCGQREKVSKEPLLSPIPEMTEDFSFMSFCQSTPKSEISMFDDSRSSVLDARSMNETAENKHGIQHSSEKDNSCLHSSLDLGKEDALPDNVSSSSSPPQDSAMNDMKDTLPWDPLEKNSPEKLKSTLNQKEQVVKSGFSSSKTDRPKELELLTLHIAGENKSKGDLLLVEGSATEPMSESDVGLNFKRFPRRSRRLGCYFSNVEGSESETPGNNSNVSRNTMEELPLTPWTVNDSESLNQLQQSIEESFRGVTRSNQKRVRRSMRRLKDAENKGLAWIQRPEDNFIGQALLGSASKTLRRMSNSNNQELELLRPKQVSRDQMLLPMKEEQEKTQVVTGSSKSRRKSTSVLNLEHKNAISPIQRNRRASLGYKSDHSYRKDPKIRKFLENQTAAHFER